MIRGVNLRRLLVVHGDDETLETALEAGKQQRQGCEGVRVWTMVTILTSSTTCRCSNASGRESGTARRSLFCDVGERPTVS